MIWKQNGLRVVWALHEKQAAEGVQIKLFFCRLIALQQLAQAVSVRKSTHGESNF